MKSRPIILVILAAIQIIAPFVDLYVGASTAHLPYDVFVRYAAKVAPFKFWFNLIGTQFLAAWAIYRPRVWSIPICLGVFLLNVYDTASPTAFASNPWIMALIIGSHIGNGALVFYFLIPAVRQVYVDRKLRWWENAPRYKVNLPGWMQAGESKWTSCLVSDISTGGVLLSGETLPDLNTRITLTLECLSYELKFDGIVRHRSTKNGPTAGIEFVDLDHRARDNLKALTNLVDRISYNSTLRKPPIWIELRDWIHQLVTTGTGLVPSVNKPAAAPAQPAPATPAIDPFDAVVAEKEKATAQREPVITTTTVDGYSVISPEPAQSSESGKVIDFPDQGDSSKDNADGDKKRAA